MKHKELDQWPLNINTAIFNSLLRRIPPKEYSFYLEEVVSALNESTAKGETELVIDRQKPPKNIRSNDWPDAHINALIKSGWINVENSPIVLDDNRLQWRRWHKEISSIILELKTRSANYVPRGISLPKANIKDINQHLNKEQQEAVKAIKDQGLILISGGPGTGKTSTVIRMIESAFITDPLIRVGLSAPTGKATRRLQDSIQKQVSSISDKYQDLILNIPALTLHKWLQSSSHGFTKNKRSPLNLDLLVVDEMSMVDLRLMQALLDAVPQNTQLVLVGDPNQLPPIESCSIWHKLQEYQTSKAFTKGAVHLTKRYRNRGEIALVSNILCEKRLLHFWDKLNSLKGSSNIAYHKSNSNNIPTKLLEKVHLHFKNITTRVGNLVEELPEEYTEDVMRNDSLNQEVELIMASLEELLILCPTRQGKWGVSEIHRTLLGRSILSNPSKWPQGMPVICSVNQAELGLANGDVGIVIGEGAQRRFIFRTINKGTKVSTSFIHPARLKFVEPALAMTIHKAQGSEANNVLLLWPENTTDANEEEMKVDSNENYNKRLLYTAITRARDRVDIFIKG